jgi:hypothetical protein
MALKKYNYNLLHMRSHIKVPANIAGYEKEITVHFQIREI